MKQTGQEESNVIADRAASSDSLVKLAAYTPIQENTWQKERKIHFCFEGKAVDCSYTPPCCQAHSHVPEETGLREEAQGGLTMHITQGNWEGTAPSASEQGGSCLFYASLSRHCPRH